MMKIAAAMNALANMNSRQLMSDIKGTRTNRPPTSRSNGLVQLKLAEKERRSSVGMINGGRVIRGGLAAGLLYNLINWFGHGVILKAASSETMSEMNMAPPATGQILQLWLIWMVYGVTLAWVYAAIRPRFGAGLGTAVRATLVVWIAGIVVPALPNVVLGFASAGMILADGLVGLIGLMVGGSMAGYLYRENEQVADPAR
jgi:hypothetical protein